MKRILLVYCSFVLLIISCVSDYDGLLSESEPIPVLNGVLYSDSLLSLNLSLSNHPNENNFEPIDNATINLTKNGKQISPSYNLSDDGTTIIMTLALTEIFMKLKFKFRVFLN